MRYRTSGLSKLLKNKNQNLYRNLLGIWSKANEWYSQATPTYWTYHGGEHVSEVERLLNCLVTDKLRRSLTPDEIYILLAACYWHDYGMTQGESYREIHNVISRDSLYDVSTDQAVKTHVTFPNPQRNYAKAVALLCYAHRDYKVRGYSVDTLSQVQEKEPFSQGYVHLRALACLLRLADELDLTQRRFPEELIAELPQEHLEYVKEHTIIKHVDIDNFLFTIKLCVDEDVLTCDPYAEAVLRRIERRLQAKLKVIFDYGRNMADYAYRLGYRDIDISEPKKVKHIAGKQLLEYIKHSGDLDAKKASALLEAFGDEAIAAMKRGNTVHLPGVGEFSAPIKEAKPRARLRKGQKKTVKMKKARRKRRKPLFRPAPELIKKLKVSVGY